MAKRRGNQEGSIHPRTEDGTWRAQITLEGRRLSHTAKTKKECQEWLKKTIAQIDNGLTFAGAQTTLTEYLEGWLSGIKSSLRPVTWYQYDMTCHKHIIPTLGKYKLKDLRPDYIQKLYETKVQAGAGYRTVEMIHSTLHKSLAQAVKIGLIGRNPTEATTPPRPVEREMEFYDEAEVSLFLQAAKGDRNEALYHLDLATGLRQSEILALKWSDLDWTKRSLTVQRQLKRNGPKEDYYSNPKTRSGRRTIILGTRTIATLREHSKRLDQERKEMGERWQENDLIFPSTVGTPMNQSNLYTSFKKLIKKNGLKEIRFHDLRHTAASLMLNHGIPAIIVSRRLGHSKVSITLDIYGHLIPEMQNDAAELIDDLITPVEVDLHRNCTGEVKVTYL